MFVPTGRSPATAGALREAPQRIELGLAVDKTVILLHPPLPLVGASIVMGRERQQSDGTLVNGELGLGGVAGAEGGCG